MAYEINNEIKSHLHTPPSLPLRVGGVPLQQDRREQSPLQQQQQQHVVSAAELRNEAPAVCMLIQCVCARVCVCMNVFTSSSHTHSVDVGDAFLFGLFIVTSSQ